MTDVGDATQTTGHIIWLHLCVECFEIFSWKGLWMCEAEMLHLCPSKSCSEITSSYSPVSARTSTFMNALHCIHVLLSPWAIMTCGWTLKNWGGSAEKENSNAKTHPEPENRNLLRIACAQSDCRAYSSLLAALGKPLSVPQIWLTSTSASAASQIPRAWNSHAL